MPPTNSPTSKSEVTTLSTLQQNEGMADIRIEDVGIHMEIETTPIEALERLQAAYPEHDPQLQEASQESFCKPEIVPKEENGSEPDLSQNEMKENGSEQEKPAKPSIAEPEHRKCRYDDHGLDDQLYFEHTGGVIYRLRSRDAELPLNKWDPIAIKARMAEAYFYETMDKFSLDPAISVAKVDVVQNRFLEDEFEKERKEMVDLHFDDKVILLLLDYKIKNFQCVVRDNVPQSLKYKKTDFGEGFYLSEYPNLLFNQDNFATVILCRVLPGNIQEEGNKLRNGIYDSFFGRRYIEKNGKTIFYNQIVVDSSNQIMPDSVIHVKRDPKKHLRVRLSRDALVERVYQLLNGKDKTISRDDESTCNQSSVSQETLNNSQGQPTIGTENSSSPEDEVHDRSSDKVEDSSRQIKMDNIESQSSKPENEAFVIPSKNLEDLSAPKNEVQDRSGNNTEKGSKPINESNPGSEIMTQDSPANRLEDSPNPEDGIEDIPRPEDGIQDRPGSEDGIQDSPRPANEMEKDCNLRICPSQDSSKFIQAQKRTWEGSPVQNL